MILQTIVVTITFAAMAGAAILPVEETDLQLTALDTDTGNWTANIGNMEVNVEHKTDSKNDKNGNWTLAITRTTYRKANENASHNEKQESTTEDDTHSNTISEYNPLPRQPIMIKVPIDYVPIGYEPDVLYNQPKDANGFELFEGVGWFKLDDRQFNFNEAHGACKQMSAHLAIPDTPSRVRVLRELFLRHSEVEYFLYHQVYVGVNDPDMDRIFTTVAGENFNPSFPIWMENEPNNFYPGEYCVAFNGEGRINDVPCDIQLPFFCEKHDPMSGRKPFH